MAVEVMVLFFTDCGLSSTEKLVGLYLGERSHNDGTSIFPSVALICRVTGLSERTVRAKLKSLREKGIISIDQYSTFNTPTRYRINIKQLKILGGAADAPLVPQGVQNMHPGGAADAPLGVHILPVRGAADAPKPSINPQKTTVSYPASKERESSSSSVPARHNGNGNGKTMTIFSDSDKHWMRLTDKHNLTTAERNCISRAEEIIRRKFGAEEFLRVLEYAAGESMSPQRLVRLAEEWKPKSAKKTETKREIPRKTYS